MSFSRFLIKYKFVFGWYAITFFAGIWAIISFDKLDLTFIINQNHTTWLDYFFYFVTYLGDGIFALLLSITIFFFDKRTALTLLLAYLLSAALAQTLKHFIFNHYNRPYFFIINKEAVHHVLGLIPHSYNSFPSGHTTTAFALYGVLSSRYGNAWLYLLLAALVGYSRMYLFQHFITDVFAGSVLGLLTSMIVYFYFFEKNYAQRVLKFFIKRHDE
jgi:membrane-associated phospholipid phosphatase